MAKSHVVTRFSNGSSNPAEVASYATLENLDRALTKHGVKDHRHVVVKTTDDRFTAIFPQRNFEDHGIGYLGFYAQMGFMTLG